MEFGLRWGQNLALLIAIRGMLEPYNIKRSIIGFDTFEGLPKDWKVGGRSEKKGSYSSDGIIPKIKGGKFIKGKFEDTLPIFFSKLECT